MVTGKTDETPYTDAQYLKLVEITQSCSKPIHGCVLRELWRTVISLLQGKTDPGSSFDWTGYRSLLPNPQQIDVRPFHSNHSVMSVMGGSPAVEELIAEPACLRSSL
jgi:N-acetyl-anhydromuramyl-L-alanine amidase AmpD